MCRSIWDNVVDMVEKVAASFVRTYRENAAAEQSGSVKGSASTGPNGSQPLPTFSKTARWRKTQFRLPSIVYSLSFPSLSPHLSLSFIVDKHTIGYLQDHSILHPPPTHTHTHTHTYFEYSPTEACKLVDTVLACFLTEITLLLHHIWCIHPDA